MILYIFKGTKMHKKNDLLIIFYVLAVNLATESLLNNSGLAIKSFSREI